MKELAVVLVVLSVISLKSCNEAPSHEEVELKLLPSYVDGVLYLTPVISYLGDGAATCWYSDAVAWIEKVTDENGTVIYEQEALENSGEHRSVITDEDNLPGLTAEIKAEPGMYEVWLNADYYLEEGEQLEEMPEKRYSHKIKQKIEVKK
ncbi:hypothetical protein SAMN05421736_106149 [Evansella caseinilytica]|uniref:Uncharacterized protein n=1 Tax=Evansella caseinilytica TaxID=1503961 RepID=A0A1H3QF73_9BACI|nr:hypothetical protein [Evansella caseinilytica]SDZ12046.1 hypothetical protein SAMN05421736_106149 [Evansella caseinilytica]